MNYYMFIVALCLLGNGVAAQHLERSVLSNGAVRARAEQVAIAGTIGQPMIGVSASVFHGALHGFWYDGALGVLTVERTRPGCGADYATAGGDERDGGGWLQRAVEAALVTLQGQRIAELSFVAAGGGAVARVDCTERASGLYLVQVRCSGQTMFLPMMIAK